MPLEYSYSGSHEYVRRWIRFELSERCWPFRLGSRPGDGYPRFFGAEHGSALAVLYNADYSQGPRRLLFAVNPHHEDVYIWVGDLALAHWRQLAGPPRPARKARWLSVSKYSAQSVHRRNALRNPTRS